ncbi:TPA_asm: LO4 [Tilapia adomavirus 1]|uniref:LO4 n=1 Tax=Tilapia adomavirus 1 TaxID=2597803 RepID=A0A5H3CM32_9VIRU|nr:TPA_asm: LO4 [Tilapia adomavirus 1]
MGEPLYGLQRFVRTNDSTVNVTVKSAVPSVNVPPAEPPTVNIAPANPEINVHPPAPAITVQSAPPAINVQAAPASVTVQPAVAPVNVAPASVTVNPDVRVALDLSEVQYKPELFIVGHGTHPWPQEDSILILEAKKGYNYLPFPAFHNKVESQIETKMASLLGSFNFNTNNTFRHALENELSRKMKSYVLGNEFLEIITNMVEVKTETIKADLTASINRDIRAAIAREYETKLNDFKTKFTTEHAEFITNTIVTVLEKAAKGEVGRAKRALDEFLASSASGRAISESDIDEKIRRYLVSFAPAKSDLDGINARINDLTSRLSNLNKSELQTINTKLTEITNRIAATASSTDLHTVNVTIHEIRGKLRELEYRIMLLEHARR